MGIVIGDVTDKGVPAALFMALARTTLRSCLAAAGSPLAGIHQANRLICTDAGTGMFVSLYYVGLEAGSRALTCISAGHNPPLHLRASDRTVQPLPRGGLPLGIQEAASAAETRIELLPGDSLLLYTDGAVDAQSEEGEFFGLQRLAETMDQSRLLSAAGMVEAIGASVAGFAAGTQPFDDITMIAIKSVG
jgi:sigma-B regulation protein RsbU (phosphoserine phosphatase)